MIVHFGNTVHK